MTRVLGIWNPAIVPRLTTECISDLVTAEAHAGVVKGHTVVKIAVNFEKALN